ncbi:DMT family transporter [Actinoplanes sp. LDG1-06]|uniref:DMT family transporter n=1 Tax=Paractinoplanes ovalisporus TaxID=2810368 RepID=A0ABS2AVK4_9ACTN|nr:DMT family transporter [Actinoplanes ovalisporus]MBM2623907.1 DMT family transporter [Actinoplanes ovalisporus]
MSDPPARVRRLGLLQISAAGVLWGTGGLAVTLLHERDDLGAMTVSAWRMLLAAVALIGFAAATGRVRDVRALFRARPGLTVLVGCGTAAYQGLYFVSVLLVGVSVSTVVSLGLAPVLAATWEHLRAGTRPSPRQAAVLLAALTGLVLISATAGHGSTAPGNSPYAGLALAVAAGVTYAATTVLGHSLAQRTDPTTLTTGTTTVGAVALLPFLIVAALTGQPVIGTSPGSLTLIAYLGLATMALAYGLLYAGLRTTTGSAATIATLLEPVSAALLAATLLGERLPWPAILGGVLILGAVAALRPAEHPDRP